MRLKEAREYVARFNAGESSPEENATFRQWLTVASSEELNVIANTYESMHDSWVLGGGPSDEWVMQLERKLDRSAGKPEWTIGESIEEGGGFQVVPIREQKGRRKRWMVAACAAILVGVGLYVIVARLRAGSVAPEDKNNLLSMTVSNPPGNDQKAFVLPDGSKVLLTAGTTLKYPPAFAGHERSVELSGDAFFDVKGSPQRPFLVRIRDAQVEVLGTSFEVTAYDDGAGSRTTLLDGRLRVTSGRFSEMLKQPGDQAEIIYPSPGVGAEINVHSGMDTKAIVDWRKGFYDANMTDLKTVLHVLARRYNVTVQYQPNISDPAINGSLDLHKNLGDLVKGLNNISLPKDIQIKSNGKVLTVISY